MRGNVLKFKTRTSQNRRIGIVILIENKASAERAVLDFHQQLISGQYHDIYAASDAEFRKAMSESDATALFTAVNTKLGHPRSSELKNWRVDLLVNGTFTERNLRRLELKKSSYGTFRATERFFFGTT
jgi:hypothetical protein